MVLWQSDLRISWRAQWFSLLLHGVVAALVLLVPWPLSYTPIWLLLLSLVVFDCVRSQRRIHARRGEIKLLTDSRLRWQNANGRSSGRRGLSIAVCCCVCAMSIPGADSIFGWRRTAWTPESGAICAGWCCKNRRRSKPRQEKCSAISPRICSHQLWMRSSLRSYWLVSSSARPTNSWPSAITGFGLVNS